MATMMRISAVSRRLMLMGLPKNMTLIRPLSLSAVRLVDKPLFDDFTRKKSEFRIAWMSDKRVRERHMLLIPYCICFAVSFYYLCWLLATWYW